MIPASGERPNDTRGNNAQHISRYIDVCVQMAQQ